MIIAKNSKQGNLIKQTEKVFGKRWGRDFKGDYINVVSDKIHLLTESEMRIGENKNYVFVYRKNNEKWNTTKK